MADEEVVPSTENSDLIPEQDSTVNETQESSPESRDYEGEIKALKSQLERFEERSRHLEQTARLQEEALRRSQPPQRQRDEDSGLPKELEDLDKTLEPLWKRRLESATKPLIENTSRMYDQMDAINFELYLTRNYPDVFEQEGNLDKVYQDVETVRQRASQQYGQWISRADAFMFLEGTTSIREKQKTRAAKKTTQVRDEAKRLQQVKAAGTSAGTTPGKKDPGSEIQAIRAKAAKGERLTDAERGKMRDFLSEVQF